MEKYGISYNKELTTGEFFEKYFPEIYPYQRLYIRYLLGQTRIPSSRRLGLGRGRAYFYSYI